MDSVWFHTGLDVQIETSIPEGTMEMVYYTMVSFFFTSAIYQSSAKVLVCLYLVCVHDGCGCAYAMVRVYGLTLLSKVDYRTACVDL
jgi:hypothetical protein